jgi:hypothetical protein
MALQASRQVEAAQTMMETASDPRPAIFKTALTRIQKPEFTWDLLWKSFSRLP